MKITIKKCLTIPYWLYIVSYKQEILMSGTEKTRNGAFKEAFNASLLFLHGLLGKKINILGDEI